MNRSRFRRLIFFLAIGALAACNPPSPSAFGNESPPQIASTPTAAATYIAETLDPAESPAQMLIVSPGAGSPLRSPILLEVLFVPPPGVPIRIELVAQNGSLLARKILLMEALNNVLAELRTPIYFEIDRSELEAHLIVSHEDDYGRLKALDSVPVSLRSAGRQILLPNESATHITIALEENGAGHAGELVVSGISATPAGRPLSIELITRTGRVLAFGEVYPTFEVSDLGYFSITLNYEIEEPEWVLIAVSERENGVTIHYACLEILLTP